MIYNSNRKFKMWAYIVSHSSLLLRSEMKFPDQDNYTEDQSYNIDLEFWAVNYINIPTILNNIIIKEITVKEIPTEINKNLLKFDMKIFELESEEKKYYIIAGGFLIGKNKWIDQDRILDSNLNLEHEEVILITN